MKNNFGEQEPILCVPPSKIDIFLDQYHTSLLEDTQELLSATRHLSREYIAPIYLITLGCT